MRFLCEPSNAIGNRNNVQSQYGMVQGRHPCSHEQTVQHIQYTDECICNVVSAKDTKETPSLRPSQHCGVQSITGAPRLMPSGKRPCPSSAASPPGFPPGQARHRSLHPGPQGVLGPATRSQGKSWQVCTPRTCYVNQPCLKRHSANIELSR